MKRLICALLIVLFAAPAFAEELPPRKETLSTMVRVNDYFMKKFADPTAVMPYWSRKKAYESNIWTRGVYYEGLMALYAIYPENRYYDYACRWADFHKWGCAATRPRRATPTTTAARRPTSTSTSSAPNPTV